MQRKIQDRQRERAWEMYETGDSITDIAKSINISYTSAWGLTEGRRQGFKNRSEYQEHLAVQKGFKNLNEYMEHLAVKKGFKNRSEYQEHLAVQKGFKNLSKYREHLAVKRSQRHTNKELSDLIKYSLKKLGKNQTWLAEQIGVTRQTVSSYIHGKNIPLEETLSLLFSTLEIKRKPKSLDELVEE